MVIFMAMWSIFPDCAKEWAQADIGLLQHPRWNTL